ncbi:MAG: hypothetical protein AAGF11_49545 [Myxococcota bacterium]
MRKRTENEFLSGHDSKPHSLQNAHGLAIFGAPDPWGPRLPQHSMDFAFDGGVDAREIVIQSLVYGPICALRPVFGPHAIVCTLDAMAHGRAGHLQ